MTAALRFRTAVLLMVFAAGVVSATTAAAQRRSLPARLPRMTMGLGIVTDATTRFYPMDSVDELGAVIDELDGRWILVYVDPATFTPAALFVDARSATLEGREVRLDTGGVVRDELLYDAGGTRTDADRPQQFFSRWYGFALTFPEPEIFGR